MLRGFAQPRLRTSVSQKQQQSACHAPQGLSRRSLRVSAMQPNSHSSHYAVLGVAVDATQHEIKRAFRLVMVSQHCLGMPALGLSGACRDFSCC